MKPVMILKIIAVTTLLLLAVPFLRFTAALWREWTAGPWLPQQMHLAYTDTGTGRQPVLFLHGLAGSQAYFADRYEPVPAGMHFFAPDLIGFGSSPKPDGPYDLSMHASAVALFYQRTIAPVSDQPVVLVAHSLGALIALELARTKAVPLDRLYLIGTPLYPSTEIARESIARDGMMYAAMVNDNKLMALSCFFRDSYRLPFLAPLFHLPRDVYMDATRHSWTSLNGSLHNSVMNFEPQRYAGLDGSRILFLHGERDNIAPPASVQQFADLIHAGIRIYPEGDHQLFLRQPRAILDLIFADLQKSR
jgi:pimeloyl-ACP methyl ester carboxylesterase